MDEDLRRHHQRTGVELFNRCWDLIDQADRTVDDDTEMLLTAMTSRWHWGQIGGPAERATGDWQISHVASLLGLGDLAVRFADANLTTAAAEGWSGWRLASAHEGRARAAAASGDAAARDQHVAAALAALDDEPDEGDRAHIASQVATVPEV